MKSLIRIFFLVILLSACKAETRQEEENLTSRSEQYNAEKIIDLTHSFSEETIYWVTAKEFELDVVAQGVTDKGYYYSANNFATAEHGGTHLDAPIHFAKDGQSVEQIPLENLIGPAIKIDVSAKAMQNPDYLIGIEDLTAWEQRENLKIPEGVIVLLQTGFSTFYPDKLKYLGTEERGEKAVRLLHFPGLAPEAAAWLINNRSIKAIGIDTPSIDYGQSENFRSHVILLSENIPAFENLTNLEELPAKDFKVVALPMKIAGGSGAPLRIVALISE